MRKITEAEVVEFIASKAPWLGGVPSAWFVGSASYDLLRVPWPVAVSIALVTEALGLTLSHTVLVFYAWNLKRMRKEFRAPTKLAALFLGVYLVATVGLTVVLKILPGLALYAPVIFPALALTGYVQLVMLKQHERRVSDYAKSKKSKTEGERSGEPKTRKQVRKTSTVSDPRERFFDDARSGAIMPAQMTGKAIGLAYGKSAATGRRWKTAWQNNGGAAKVDTAIVRGGKDERDT